MHFSSAFVSVNLINELPFFLLLPFSAFNTVDNHWIRGHPLTPWISQWTQRPEHKIELLSRPTRAVPMTVVDDPIYSWRQSMNNPSTITFKIQLQAIITVIRTHEPKNSLSAIKACKGWCISSKNGDSSQEIHYLS
jgi:hypothetical protein